MNKKDILDELNRVLSEGRTATLTVPPPKRVSGNGSATIVDPKRNLGSVFTLVRLLDGEWVQIGPYSKHAHQYLTRRAKEESVEMTSRVRDDGDVDFYMRRKPVVLASAVDTIHV